jgi:hypothetical protein
MAPKRNRLAAILRRALRVLTPAGVVAGLIVAWFNLEGDRANLSVSRVEFEPSPLVASQRARIAIILKNTGRNYAVVEGAATDRISTTLPDGRIYDPAEGVEFPWPVAQIILQHHERLDGSGYPRGLARDAILQEAKVLAVADVLDAMMTRRPYHEGLGLEAALREIETGKGKLYDPAVVDACVSLFRQKAFSFE